MNKRWKKFNSENLLMSICGHLFLVAIMIASVAIVLERAQLVAPDRVQIIEIDLDNIKVSGDETKLYNVGNPEPKQQAEKQTSAKKEKQVESIEKVEIEKTTLVDEEEKKEDLEKEDKDTAKEEKKLENAPKKKKVVRVNREVLSLDRTLTVSVVDALRVAMTRCWVIDSSRPDIADIRAVAHLKMRKNGTVQDVWFESEARAETDAGFAYVLETIKSAINVCQPFRMLPQNEFDKWQKIQLTFYPTQGKVM
ncbi:MAG: hypothetical protein IKW67_02805 [Alphaproteobacteria bacterium]|nr:hypothetical protein [Alphaproteobacteria bacterium]